MPIRRALCAQSLYVFPSQPFLVKFQLESLTIPQPKITENTSTDITRIGHLTKANLFNPLPGP